ncbi:TVP38/TMEM64 family protein [Natrialbaceae archaeon GCM10025810]|uniref:TVP38/TMEM64 family protein n=1 Tax=Halovalidus salilacus TaxID=3075124 RepID=UPI00361FAA11
MQIFTSRSAFRHGLVVACFLLAAFFVAYAGARQYAPFLFDATELRTWIGQFGAFAPLVFVLVQAVQVIVAPVPGQVIALVSGYVFGPTEGTVYSLVGVILGSAIAFSLSKRFGRPFVEKLLHEDVVTRFDGFVERVGIPGLVAFVIIPGLPDDAICFLSGLTKLRLRTFLVVISIGRLPAYVITVYAGGKLATGEVTIALGLLGIIIVGSVIGYSRQDSIRRVIEQFGN